MAQVKSCQQCGTGIVGRSDKRFCSDQCRYQSNNTAKRQNQEEKRIQQVNTALRKNRSILRQLSPKGKTTIPRQYLELAGFDFRYLTQFYRTHRGNTYHLCYDYGYLLLPEEKVLIVNWQPYMEAT
ncbi:hypothetical protein ACD591_08105 [Rufibacter glacialis]|uniref:DUF2116 family Zn-ribbon domain-containing protein n=1 Tax=Rufibacter glacialis TaxID=1259555 RepID=A0A5M8QBR8_9BACT|nr:hypothetical protein [Rufibacter glacialis]KAA6432588.1 hypothetical protein FOE74_16005 [Rufibacter glacialis]GGK80079.1 hypothetical protein GCM10011405_29820 [Rufibacter glacialis]